MKQYILTEIELDSLYRVAYDKGFQHGRSNFIGPVIIMELNEEGVYVEVP